MYEKAINATGVSIMGVATIAQTNEIFQLVQIILTSVSAAVILAFNIWKWWKKAKADGKIDDKEVDELANILKKDKENK